MFAMPLRPAPAPISRPGHSAGGRRADERGHGERIRPGSAHPPSRLHSCGGDGPRQVVPLVALRPGADYTLNKLMIFFLFASLFRRETGVKPMAKGVRVRRQALTIAQDLRLCEKMPLVVSRLKKEWAA